MHVHENMQLPEISEDEWSTSQRRKRIVHKVVLIVPEALDDLGAVFRQHKVLKDEESPTKGDLSRDDNGDGDDDNDHDGGGEEDGDNGNDMRWGEDRRW